MEIISQFKKLGIKVIILIKAPLEWVLQAESLLARKWVSNAHKRLKSVQWTYPPNPKYFDHHIDIFYQWLASRDSSWLERGVFSSLALREGCCVLELACGDGFFTRNFYSLKAAKIIACDFDEGAIKTALKKNNEENIKYVLVDIRYELPQGNFDNIIIDAALAYLSESEIRDLMQKVKSRLKNNGIFSGCTVVKRADLKKRLQHHKHEFDNKLDLSRFLTPYFKNVKVFETICQSSHNIYFFASDFVLPFDRE